MPDNKKIKPQTELAALSIRLVINSIALSALIVIGYTQWLTRDWGALGFMALVALIVLARTVAALRMLAALRQTLHTEQETGRDGA